MEMSVKEIKIECSFLRQAAAEMANPETSMEIGRVMRLWGMPAVTDRYQIEKLAAAKAKLAAYTRSQLLLLLSTLRL